MYLPHLILLQGSQRATLTAGIIQAFLAYCDTSPRCARGLDTEGTQSSGLYQQHPVRLTAVYRRTRDDKCHQKTGATPKKEREDERERKKERLTIVKRGGKVSNVENEGPPLWLIVF